MNKKTAPLKGLFFRELYLLRKQLIAILEVGVAVGVIMALAALSFKYGNLAQLIDSTEELGTQMTETASVLLIFGSMVFAMMPAFNIENADHDLSRRWLCCLYSSPVSEKKFIGVKFAIMTAFMLIAVLLTTVLGAALYGITGAPFSAEVIATVVCVMSLVIVFDVVLTALTYHLKSMTNAVVYVCIGLLVVYVCFFICGIIMTNGKTKNLTESLMQLACGAAPFAPLIAIAALAVGYLACVKIMQRREN